MIYNVVGESGMAVSAVGFGCWGISGGSMWGPQDESESIRAIHAAIDRGINFFDTAEGYGNGYSEEVLGRAVSGRRHEIIIATKVAPANMAPKDLRSACENSLRRLETDYIDLYQLHWPNSTIAPNDVIEALEDLKRNGAIRHYGVSNFGVRDLREFDSGTLISNQLPYSLLFRAIEYEILSACSEKATSVLAYSPLLHGLLSDKYADLVQVPDGRARTRHFSSARPSTRHGEAGHEELTFRTIQDLRDIARRFQLPLPQLAVRWLLQRPGVASVIMGIRTERQALANAEIADDEIPGEAILAATRVSEALKSAMGKNPDPWQADHRTSVEH